MAAYHLHHGVEKSIKFSLNQHGQEYPYTHDILKLLERCDRHCIIYPEWIYENANLLNTYATETRYGTDLVANRRKVKELLELANSYAQTLKPLQDDNVSIGF